jgi:alpha-L-rhamnosidase
MGHIGSFWRAWIETTDGRTQSIVTDGLWRTTIDGPIRFSEIYDGEIQDAQRAIPGWDSPGFDDRALKSADQEALDDVKIVAQKCDPIRKIKEMKPIEMTEPKPGIYVFDMGQNMVGWCKNDPRDPTGYGIACMTSVKSKNPPRFFGPNERFL